MISKQSNVHMTPILFQTISISFNPYCHSSDYNCVVFFVYLANNVYLNLQHILLLIMYLNKYIIVTYKISNVYILPHISHFVLLKFCKFHRDNTVVPQCLLQYQLLDICSSCDQKLMDWQNILTLRKC